MGHFRGTVQGYRGEASRLGSADSGLRVSAASWSGRVDVSLFTANGVDIVHVALAPHHGKGTSKLLYEGPVSGAPIKGKKRRRPDGAFQQG